MKDKLPKQGDYILYKYGDFYFVGKVEIRKHKKGDIRYYIDGKDLDFEEINYTDNEKWILLDDIDRILSSD